MADPPDPREQTMAELRASLHAERLAAAEGLAPDPLAVPDKARPSARDDELLDDPPANQLHRGRLGAWQSANRVRWVVFGVFGLIAVFGVWELWQRASAREYERLHPLPEVEATIDPATSREMTLSEGKFRLGLGREAPAVEVIHLPDRDIVLAEGEDKAQFKVEISGGKTTRLVVLTGNVREILHEGAEPLL